MASREAISPQSGQVDQAGLVEVVNDMEATLALWRTKVEAAMKYIKTCATLQLKMAAQWDDFQTFLMQQFDLIFQDFYSRHGSSFNSYKQHPNYSIKALLQEDALAQLALNGLRKKLKDKYDLQTKETLDIGPKVFRDALILFVNGGRIAKHTEDNRRQRVKIGGEIVPGRESQTRPFIKDEE